MTPAEERLAPPVRGGEGLRPAAPPDLAGAYSADPMEEPADERSLLEDLQAAYEDGKTYVAAELAFQKTRAAYVTRKIKSVAIFGAGAALAGLLALIGLTVGLIMALATLIGPLGATGVVVAVLLVAAFLCMRRAGKKWGELMNAFGSGAEERP